MRIHSFPKIPILCCHVNDSQNFNFSNSTTGYNQIIELQIFMTLSNTLPIFCFFPTDTIFSKFYFCFVENKYISTFCVIWNSIYFVDFVGENCWNLIHNFDNFPRDKQCPEFSTTASFQIQLHTKQTFPSCKILSNLPCSNSIYTKQNFCCLLD